MIHRADCLRKILELAPGFQEQWNRYLDEWKDEKDTPGLSIDLMEFAGYLYEQFDFLPQDQLIKIFNYVEILMLEGDQEVQDATATCFLEALQNAISLKKISGRKLFKLLGPESIAYCRAWDEFNGSQTAGFWEDGTEFNPRKE